MKIIMKKIFFPFTKTYSNLKKYWWHRVLVILFFIGVAIAPYKLTMLAYENSFDPLFSCDKYAYDDFLEREYNDSSVAKWENEKAECENKYFVSENTFFFYGAILYIVFFYGLQAVYSLIIVKLVVYIVRGDQKNSDQSS